MLYGKNLHASDKSMAYKTLANNQKKKLVLTPFLPLSGHCEQAQIVFAFEINFKNGYIDINTDEYISN